MKASTAGTRETGALTAEDRSAFAAAVGAFGAVPARAIADGLALVGFALSPRVHTSSSAARAARRR